MDSTSDEGFNSGGQTTTTNSPDMDRNGKKQQRRRKQRRNRTGSNFKTSQTPEQSKITLFKLQNHAHPHKAAQHHRNLRMNT